MPEEQQNVMLCPHCRSANIEPKGIMWHCLDCGEFFENALVQPAGYFTDKEKKGEKDANKQ